MAKIHVQCRKKSGGAGNSPASKFTLDDSGPCKALRGFFDLYGFQETKQDPADRQFRITRKHGKVTAHTIDAEWEAQIAPA